MRMRNDHLRSEMLPLEVSLLNICLKCGKIKRDILEIKDMAT